MFGHYCWTVDDKNSAPPKNDGKKVMVSTFCSRDFGFGFDLTQEQLDKVNKYREGKYYKDVKGAEELFRSAAKAKRKLTKVSSS